MQPPPVARPRSSRTRAFAARAAASPRPAAPGHAARRDLPLTSPRRPSRLTPRPARAEAASGWAGFVSISSCRASNAALFRPRVFERCHSRLPRHAPPPCSEGALRSPALGRGRERAPAGPMQRGGRGPSGHRRVARGVTYCRPGICGHPFPSNRGSPRQGLVISFT
jgi:hypothetical protein